MRRVLNAKQRWNASKWIERVEFAGFDAWEDGEVGGGETEFTSTEPPPRHSAPDCDIYPPLSPANPMLLPPTRFNPPSFALLHSLSPLDPPLASTPTLCPFHFNHPPLRGFSAAFHLDPHYIPPPLPSHYPSPPLRFCHRSAMLSDSVCRCGVWTRGQLSAPLLPRRSVYWYMVLLEEGRFFASFFLFQGLEGWHSLGARIRNLSTIHDAWIDGCACARPHRYARLSIYQTFQNFCSFANLSNRDFFIVQNQRREKIKDRHS